jgi:hypothetical protein
MSTGSALMAERWQAAAIRDLSITSDPASSGEPHSGQTHGFFDVSKADRCEIDAAMVKINPGLIVFLDTLVELVGPLI